MNIVIIGLSVTSSWGNGHATTYRGLIRELKNNDHDIFFLERDFPWYALHRDMPEPSFCRVGLYNSVAELQAQYEDQVKAADLVIVGSYVSEGVEVGEWVCKTARGIKAFYDIDTPVTLGRLEKGDFLYISPALISKYDLYLSFTGGPTLEYLEKYYGSPMARPLYCSFDPELYFPEPMKKIWELGYLGTYSDDRQVPLEKLMLETARLMENKKFIVAGPLYPDHINWPSNVERVDHVSPEDHRKFYTSQCFTLNITRSDMIKRGYSPSVRLFEAAACAIPVISDNWAGMDEFFEPGIDILISESKEDTMYYLQNIPEEERTRIGNNARTKVLNAHTAAHRAKELENYVAELSTVGV
jgi:spore maturation protein CgeB